MTGRAYACPRPRGRARICGHRAEVEPPVQEVAPEVLRGANNDPEKRIARVLEHKHDHDEREHDVVAAVDIVLFHSFATFTRRLRGGTANTPGGTRRAILPLEEDTIQKYVLIVSRNTHHRGTARVHAVDVRDEHEAGDCEEECEHAEDDRQVEGRVRARRRRFAQRRPRDRPPVQVEVRRVYPELVVLAV